jgi:hypothetical protein
MPARKSSTSAPAKAAPDQRDRRKLIGFDPETWNALDLLARDSLKTWQELADEAFADLLKKHGRPTDLRSALRKSAQEGGGERAEKRRDPRRRSR